jgi:phosphatidylserine decarboxylase
MMAREASLIAGEAWWPISVVLALSALSLMLPVPWFAVVGLLFALMLLLLFRDPHRQIPATPLAVLSPVDGEVTAIDVMSEQDAGGRRTVISIRLSLLAAWSIRAPVEGKVMGLRGLKSGPSRGLWLRTDENDEVITELDGRSRPYWCRPVAFIRPGERLGQGQRFGYRRLARTARVHIYGPVNVRVSEGDRIRAGADLLAMLVHD